MRNTQVFYRAGMDDRTDHRQPFRSPVTVLRDRDDLVVLRNSTAEPLFWLTVTLHGRGGMVALAPETLDAEGDRSFAIPDPMSRSGLRVLLSWVDEAGQEWIWSQDA